MFCTFGTRVDPTTNCRHNNNFAIIRRASQGADRMQAWRPNTIKIAIGCITRSSGVMIEEEFKGIQSVGGYEAVILYRVM